MRAFPPSCPNHGDRPENPLWAVFRLSLSLTQPNHARFGTDVRSSTGQWVTRGPNRAGFERAALRRSELASNSPVRYRYPSPSQTVAQQLTPERWAVRSAACGTRLSAASTVGAETISVKGGSSDEPIHCQPQSHGASCRRGHSRDCRAGSRRTGVNPVTPRAHLERVDQPDFGRRPQFREAGQPGSQHPTCRFRPTLSGEALSHFFPEVHWLSYGAQYLSLLKSFALGETFRCPSGSRS
jgi:hypothetical protein